MSESNEDMDTEHLITLVSLNPCLWDKSLENYHCRTSTTEAWRGVCRELNPRFEALNDKEKNIFGKAVMKKWKNIRDQWMKATKKVDSQKKSGAAAKPIKHYIYHEQLSFLKKNSTLSHTESSYSEDPDELSADISIDDVDVDESTLTERPKKKTKALTPPEGEIKKGKFDVEKEILATLSKDENPIILFFKGIAPRLSDFSEDEHLQFQSGVLNLIQDIKKNRVPQPTTAPCSSTMQQHTASLLGDQRKSREWELQSHEMFPHSQEKRYSTGNTFDFL